MIAGRPLPAATAFSHRTRPWSINLSMMPPQISAASVAPKDIAEKFGLAPGAAIEEIENTIIITADRPLAEDHASPVEAIAPDRHRRFQMLGIDDRAAIEQAVDRSLEGLFCGE
jgi:hypothetical protein